MDSSIISGLIGGLLSVALCTYISKSVQSSLVKGKLRFGAFLAVLAWCCFTFVCIAVWAFLFSEDVWEDSGELIAVVGLFLGFGLGAVYCFGEYFKVGGQFDENGIDFYTPWTGRKVEAWKDLESVSFNSQANWYLLKFKSGNKIRLSNLLSGHGEVLDLIKSKGFSC